MGLVLLIDDDVEGLQFAEQQNYRRTYLVVDVNA